jgi:hypothetical protein
MVVDLPAPLGTQQAEGLPRRDAERNSVHGGHIAVLFGQAFRRYHCLLLHRAAG